MTAMGTLRDLLLDASMEDEGFRPSDDQVFDLISEVFPGISEEEAERIYWLVDDQWTVWLAEAEAEAREAEWEAMSI